MDIPDQNDVSTALGLLRDSLSSEEERIRTEGAKAMHAGDYDSLFVPSESRVSAALAARRNQYVPSLAVEVWFAHINPGGQA